MHTIDISSNNVCLCTGAADGDDFSSDCCCCCCATDGSIGRMPSSYFSEDGSMDISFVNLNCFSSALQQKQKFIKSCFLYIISSLNNNITTLHQRSMEHQSQWGVTTCTYGMRLAWCILSVPQRVATTCVVSASAMLVAFDADVVGTRDWMIFGCTHAPNALAIR